MGHGAPRAQGEVAPDQGTAEHCVPAFVEPDELLLQPGVFNQGQFTAHQAVVTVLVGDDVGDEGEQEQNAEPVG